MLETVIAAYATKTSVHAHSVPSKIYTLSAFADIDKFLCGYHGFGQLFHPHVSLEKPSVIIAGMRFFIQVG